MLIHDVVLTRDIEIEVLHLLTFVIHSFKKSNYFCSIPMFFIGLLVGYFIV
jgi:hypothetical protein